MGMQFGYCLALTGRDLAAGGPDEPSNATGVNGDQTNTSAPGSGATYLFRCYEGAGETPLLPTGALVCTEQDAVENPRGLFFQEFRPHHPMCTFHLS